MNTTHSSHNGTRLSLDIRDLPQTPFGMKSPQRSAKSKKLYQGASAGKLSRRAQRKLIETSGEEKTGSPESNEGYWGSPKNPFPSWLKPISFQDSSLKKERHVFIKIPEVEEDSESDDGSAIDIITAGAVDLGLDDEITHTTSTGAHVSAPMKFTEEREQNNKDYINPGCSNSGSCNVRIAKTNFSFREGNKKYRDSLLTDIDEDGSFIEFCHVSPRIQPVVEKHVDKGQLYYTCDSQNESNFSTSTKLPQAPVGLRKYIDAVEKVDYLDGITEESYDVIPGSPVVKKGPVMFPTEDSVLIGGPQFQPAGKPAFHQVINSTFAEFSNRKNQPINRMSLQDVSSITTGCEVVLSSDSSSISPTASPAYIKKLPAPKATNTIVILDSSDDEKGHKSTDEFQPKDTVTVRRKRSHSRRVRSNTFSDESLSLVLQMENTVVQGKSPKKLVQNCQDKLEPKSPGIRSTHALVPIEEATTELLSDPETTFHLSVSQQVLKNPTLDIPMRKTTPKEKSLQEFLIAAGGKNTTVSPTVSNGEVSPVAQWVISSPFQTSPPCLPDSTLHSDSRDTVLLSQNRSITSECLEQEGVREKESEDSRTVISVGRIAEDKISELHQTRKSPQMNVNKKFPSPRSEKNELRTDFSSESEPFPVKNDARIARIPSDKDKDLNPTDTCSLMDGSGKGGGHPASLNNSTETTVFSPNVGGQECISIHQASTVNLTQIGEELNKIYDTEWKKNKSAVLEGTTVSATGKVQRKCVLSSSEEGLTESNENLCDSQALWLHLTGKTESHPLMTDDESEEEEHFIKRNKHVKPIRFVIESSDDDDETRCHEIEEEHIYSKRTNTNRPREIEVESSHDKSKSHDVDEQSLCIKRTKSDKQRKTIVESSDGDTNCPEIEQESLYIKRNKSNKPREIVVESSDDETKCHEVDEESLCIRRTKADKLRKTGKTVIESSDDDTDCHEVEEESLYFRIAKSRKPRKTVVSSSGDENECCESEEESLFKTRNRSEKPRTVIAESSDDETKCSVFEEDSLFVTKTKTERTSKNIVKSSDNEIELGSIYRDQKNLKITNMVTPLFRSFIERQPPRETIILTSDSDEEYFPPRLVKPKTQIFVKPKPQVITETNTFHTPIGKPTKPPAVTEPRPCPKVKNKFTSDHIGSLSQHTPTLTFLSSLSAHVEPHRCHPEARPYLKNFKKCKEDLAQKLYSYYNTHVFENKLPATMNMKWNARLRKTAGFCYYQIDRSKPSGRGARLELSSKVIDAPERLRDTLIHEMCHAAAWIISGYKDGHGPLWKAWSAKAMKDFPELPSISRCHSYEIACKYTYQCTQCGYSIGRHSKSLDTERKLCGHCHGKFQLIVNPKPTPVSNHRKTSKSADPPPPPPTPQTPRTPSAFALFVKANYGSLRKIKSSHAEVMKALSAEFSKLKTNNT